MSNIENFISQDGIEDYDLAGWRTIFFKNNKNNQKLLPTKNDPLWVGNVEDFYFKVLNSSPNPKEDSCEQDIINFTLYKKFRSLIDNTEKPIISIWWDTNTYNINDKKFVVNINIYEELTLATQLCGLNQWDFIYEICEYILIWNNAQEDDKEMVFNNTSVFLKVLSEKNYDRISLEN